MSYFVSPFFTGVSLGITVGLGSFVSKEEKGSSNGRVEYVG